MNTLQLPDPLSTDDEVIFWSEFLEKELIVPAYGQGCFPWPTSESEYIPWCCPKERAILKFDNFLVSNDIVKASKKSSFVMTVNQSFEEVLKGCALTERNHEVGTWITQEVVDTYTELHHEGLAHSVEARLDNGKLVGGIYGVLVNHVFSAESMFRLASNASKVCLLHLVLHLRDRGHTWIDVQVESPHLLRWGATTLPKEAYLQLLKLEQAKEKFEF